MNNILIEHKNHDIYFNLAQENLIKAEEVYQEILTSTRFIPFGDKYTYTSMPRETSSWLSSKLLKLKKFVVASIIFSALTAEAFINFYAISKGMSYKKLKNDFSSKNYQVSELLPEDMHWQYQLPYEQRTTIKDWVVVENGGVNISGTVRKWIEIPKLFTGEYIASGLSGFRIYELDELFNLRNNLVHHRATIFNLDIEEPNWESLKSNLKSAEDKNYVNIRQAQWAADLIIKLVKALQHIDSSVDSGWLIYSE